MLGRSRGVSWHLSQCFGSEPEPGCEPSQSDVVSACAFDHTGNFLAAGDKGGRVVVWTKEDYPRPRLRGVAPPVEFKFHCEFQSHEPEFDCLKSVEIEERINAIKWLRRPADAQFLFAANDKTIKLWKLYEKDFKFPVAEEMEEEAQAEAGAVPLLPRLATVETATVARPKGIYTNAHTFHIHSISPCSDGDTFLSADDLRIHVWDINVPDNCLNVVDLKPDNLDMLSEVITAAAFHPSQCNQFVYATSVGFVNVCDMRMRLDCSNAARVFKHDEQVRTVFTDIIASISDVKWQPGDGRLILSRDFMTLKIWDTHMERRPLKVIKVHEQLRSHLAMLYETDAVFDKFGCDFSHDGKEVATGSYHNTFHIWDVEGTRHTCLEATPQNAQQRRRRRLAPQPEQDNTPLDIRKKGLHLACHPLHNVVSVCTATSLMLYVGVHDAHDRGGLSLGGGSNGGGVAREREMAGELM